MGGGRECGGGDVWERGMWVIPCRDYDFSNMHAQLILTCLWYGNVRNIFKW